MPRVVPSMVVEFIDCVYEFARKPPPHTAYIDRVQSSRVAAILDLVRELPSQLLQISGEDYTLYVTSVSALENALEIWRSARSEFELRAGKETQDRHPVGAIRHLLAQCPDEAPARETEPSGTESGRPPPYWGAR